MMTSSIKGKQLSVFKNVFDDVKQMEMGKFLFDVLAYWSDLAETKSLTDFKV